MGKILEMPHPLERRAQKIEAALDRQEDAVNRSSRADADWKDATFELAIELAAAKKELRTNQAFGRWCNEHFGDNRLSHQDRAALVRWGEDPEGTRAMLVNETSRSIQRIDARLTRPSKTPTRVNRAEEAAKVIKAETGKWPDRKTLVRVSGISSRNVDNALRTVKAVEAAQGAPTEITYTKAQEYHIEARVKAAVRARLDELEKDFETRVIARNQEEIAKLFPMLQELQEQAKLNEKYYRDLLVKNSIFTKSEGLDILRACHPDNSATDEVRKRAFIAVNAKKSYMQGEG